MPAREVFDLAHDGLRDGATPTFERSSHGLEGKLKLGPENVVGEILALSMVS